MITGLASTYTWQHPRPHPSICRLLTGQIDWDVLQRLQIAAVRRPAWERQGGRRRHFILSVCSAPVHANIYISRHTQESVRTVKGTRVFEADMPESCSFTDARRDTAQKKKKRTSVGGLSLYFFFCGCAFSLQKQEWSKEAAPFLTA